MYTFAEMYITEVSVFFHTAGVPRVSEHISMSADTCDPRNQVVNLTCSSYNDRDTTIIWKHNGERLPNVDSDKFKHTKNCKYGACYNTCNNVLTVKENGTYQCCVVKNEEIVNWSQPLILTGEVFQRLKLLYYFKQHYVGPYTLTAWQLFICKASPDSPETVLK